MNTPQDYNPPRGSKNFPEEFTFDFISSTSTALIGSEKTAEFDLRKLEAWGLAYLEFLKDVKSIQKIGKVHYFIGAHQRASKVETLKRRISYLQLVNPDIYFSLNTDQEETLYSHQSLWNPEPEALVRDKQRPRGTASKKTRNMEKELQDHIGSYEDNIGLSLLGDVFPNKKKSYGLLREVRTGVFRNTISYSDDDIILPDYMIDFVSFNKSGQIAIIELKINDPKLEVIAQLLDYALFASRYKRNLILLLENSFDNNHLPKNFRTLPIEAYVVNNHFHPRFDAVAKYYSPNGFEIPFNLSKIVIGGISAI